MKYKGLICDNCGKTYDSNQCGKYHHFCCIECRRKAGKLVASSFDENTRRKAGERITKINKTVLNKGVYREKQRAALIKNNAAKSDTYLKHYGRHVHRIIAEQMLGRKLNSNEVVHHIDGNKHNNEPNNLMVLTRSEHVKIHQINGKLTKGGGQNIHLV